MRSEDVRDLGQEVSKALETLEETARERDMLKRVLKQAVLTYHGKLLVDPVQAKKAESDMRQLMIGNGAVTLI